MSCYRSPSTARKLTSKLSTQSYLYMQLLLRVALAARRRTLSAHRLGQPLEHGVRRVRLGLGHRLGHRQRRLGLAVRRALVVRPANRRRVVLALARLESAARRRVQRHVRQAARLRRRRRHRLDTLPGRHRFLAALGLGARLLWLLLNHQLVALCRLDRPRISNLEFRMI